jgi:hypothetical protein
MIAQYTINFTLSDYTLEVIRGLLVMINASLITAIWIKAGLTASLRAEIRKVRARRKARKVAV